MVQNILHPTWCRDLEKTVSFPIRRSLQEFLTWHSCGSVNKASHGSEWTLVYTILKPYEDDRYLLRRPIRNPSRGTRYHLKAIIHTKASNYDNLPKHYHALLNFSNFDLKVSSLNRMCKQVGSLLSYFVFSDKSWSLLYFSGSLCGKYLSDKKKKEKKGRFTISCLVHDQHRVKKSHPYAQYWAGHSQPTALAAPWLAQLVRRCITGAIPYHTIPYHTIPYHTIPYHTTA